MPTDTRIQTERPRAENKGLKTGVTMLDVGVEESGHGGKKKGQPKRKNRVKDMPIYNQHTAILPGLYFPLGRFKE